MDTFNNIIFVQNPVILKYLCHIGCNRNLIKFEFIMAFTNYPPVLEQIYDFLKERPNFHSITKFEKMVEYFKALNEQVDFNFEAPHKITGKFGHKNMISLISAPDVNDKTKFLDWVYKQINE